MKTPIVLGLVAFVWLSSSWPVTADGPPAETLRIVDVQPPPGLPLGTDPSGIVVTFNRDMDPSSINRFTMAFCLTPGICGEWKDGSCWVSASFFEDLASAISPNQAYFDLTDGIWPTNRFYRLLMPAGTLSMDERDARMIALEVTEELLASAELEETIREELAAIRLAYPEATAAHASLAWAAGRLWVHLTPEAWFQYVNGVYDGLDELNAQYGPVEIVYESDSSQAIVLKFDAPYNPINLGAIYETAPGVLRTNPSYFFGSAGWDVERDLPFYTFRVAWGDCPSGCANEHVWDFSIVDGVVDLIAEYGDPLEVWSGPQIVVSSDGDALDGEFNGTLPTGDGQVGGDFVIEWPVCGLALRGVNPTLIHAVAPFDVVTGVLSELRADGDFSRAGCLGTFGESPVTDDLLMPSPNDARYYLARGMEGCSTLGYGDSSLTPDPRDDLDVGNTCP